MSFEVDLKAHLNSDAAIAALVRERVHPGIVPEGSAIPAVTYTVVYGAPQNSLDGHTSGLTRFSVQLDCWALRFDEAIELAAAVKARMDAAAASFTSLVIAYPTIDDYETETKRYRRSLDCACWFKE